MYIYTHIYLIHIIKEKTTKALDESEGRERVSGKAWREEWEKEM